MNTQDQKNHAENLYKQISDTMLSKGNDYATEDRLANFKQVGAILDMQPAQVALVLMCVKISRLNNLLNKGIQPCNESIGEKHKESGLIAIISTDVDNFFRHQNRLN